MKHLIDKILAKETFTEEEAILFIEAIDKSLLTNEQITAILIGIQVRGLQLEEMKGFRKALLSLCNDVYLDGEDAMDLCGTGGDGKNTFNISTTTSLVLAAMGKKIIKHGNYGVSSMCGSSNVLDALGFNLTSDQSKLDSSFERFNIALLHAPLFHPTLKKAAPIRKNLGIPTLFNALGPLVNPVQPKFQMTGTFNLELAKMYQQVLRPNRKAYRVVYGMDGYDELTLTDTTRLFGENMEATRTSESFEINTILARELKGGTSVQEAAAIVKNIIRGTGSSTQTNIIAANVAEALCCFDSNLDLIESFEESQQFILSGQTAKHFNLN